MKRRSFLFAVGGAAVGVVLGYILLAVFDPDSLRPDLARDDVVGVWLARDGWLWREATKRRLPVDDRQPIVPRWGDPWSPPAGNWTRLEIGKDGRIRMEHAENGAIFVTRTGKWDLKGPRVTLGLYKINGRRHGPFSGQSTNPWSTDSSPIRWPTALLSRGGLLVFAPNDGAGQTLFLRPEGKSESPK